GVGSAVAFVRIAHDIFLVRSGVGDGLPLDAGWETRPAAAAEARLYYLFDHRRGRHLQSSLKTFAAVMRAVIVERTRIDKTAEAAAGSGRPRLGVGDCCALRRAGMRRMLLIAGERGAQRAFGVGRRDGAVGNAPTCGCDLDHRLEPIKAARTGAHNLDWRLTA